MKIQDAWCVDKFSNQSKEWRVLILVMSATVLYLIGLVSLWFYRLYLHPLARFPGPRHAALSRAWLLKQKQTLYPERVFDALHRQYDTKALRIGPNELHISDVSLYKEIYNQKTPFLKHAPFYDSFLTAHTVFAEPNSALHKERRKMLNPFFSRSGVLKLESIIQEQIDLFSRKLRRVISNGPVDVSYAFRCVTVDVISQFAFGRSQNLIHESANGFDGALLRAIDEGGAQILLLQHRPILRYIAERLPLSLIAKIDRNVAQIHHLHTFAGDSVAYYHGRVKQPSHPVIFSSLEGISREAQAMEAVDILLAGSDTTAFTLATSLFYILRDAVIKNNLVDALNAAFTDPTTNPSLVELENIEYLWACVKESLRMAMPVPGQLPRVVPKGAAPLIVDGHAIPPGTVIGMSAYTMHTSTELWGPDALSFNPDRWLGPEGKNLDQHLCTFSKGIRQCIGVNIAHAEATMLLAHLFRNYDMVLKTETLEPADFFTTTYRTGVYVDFRAH